MRLLPTRAAPSLPRAWPCALGIAISTLSHRRNPSHRRSTQAQSPPALRLVGKLTEVLHDRRCDVGVRGADAFHGSDGDREREGPALDKGEERPETAHPRHAVGLAFLTERPVIGQARSSGVSRHDQADLVRERERWVRSGSLPHLSQCGLDDFDAKRNALGLVKNVHLCQDRRRDDQARDVLDDESKDSLIRLGEINEHIGVADERKQGRPFHRLRPGLVELTHRSQIEPQDFRSAAE